VLEINNVYLMDCMDGMKLIDDKSIDMILCDLPYGTTACKWDTVIPFEPLWEQYERIIKENGAIVLTASQPFTTDLINSNRKQFKYCWVWNKVLSANICSAKYQPMKVHEDICVFSKKTHRYYPITTDADPKNIRPTSSKQTKNNHYGTKMSNDRCDTKKRFPKSIITFNNRMGECNSLNKTHPTQKPVELFDYLIKTYTNENDLVLDNCMGSGTTAIACIKTNRNYIGFENDKEYFDKASIRIESEKSQLRLF